MALTFDGPNKLVVCGAGTTGITLPDLWSRYKDWLLAGNAGFALAFDTVGGEPIDAGTLVPLYIFLKNGWKIRPQEATHSLKVTDGILVVDGGGDPFVNTLGSYSVRVNFSQPVQAFGYSTTGGSSPSTASIAAAVWQEATRTLTSGGGSGGATPEEIWSYMNRTLTSGSSLAPTAAENAAAVQAALAANLALLDVAVSSRVATGTIVKANVLAIKDQTVLGEGTQANPWRPA